MAKAQARTNRIRLAEQRAAAARQRQQRKRVQLIAIILAAAIVIGGVVWLIVGRANQTPTANPNLVEVQQTPVAGQPIRFGSENAPKKVEIFFDFHCPHCVEFEERFGAAIQEAQISDKVQIHMYPMSFIDDGSVRAANAFACSAAAGFPQAYFNGLFAHPERVWSNAQLIALTTAVGKTSTPELEACITNNEQGAWVQSISSAAAARGVKGTPMMFVDGQQIDFGSMSADDMRKLLAA